MRDAVVDGLGQQHGVGHVQRHHHLLDRQPHHLLRGVGVEPPVELGRAGGVAGHVHRAAHVDDLLDQRHDLGVALHRLGDVGQRADGQDGDLARIGFDGVDDEVHRALVLHPRGGGKAVGRRHQVGIALRLRAAPGAQVAVATGAGGLLGLHRGVVVVERHVLAGVHRNLCAGAHALHALECIGHPLAQPLVARHHADAQYLDAALRLQLGRHHAQLAVVAHGVVVAVDDDLHRPIIAVVAAAGQQGGAKRQHPSQSHVRLLGVCGGCASV